MFICNFHVSGLDFRPVVRACVTDEETHKPIGMKTRYIFVQLPAFEKEESECKDLEEQWIYNIKNMGIRQEVAFREKSEIFRRLAEVANIATLTPEQRYNYEADIKNARDTLNQIRGAYQDGEEKGIEIGLAKGMEQGLAKGMEQGLAKGMEEGRLMERLNTARILIELNMDDAFIEDKTGLPIEQIRSLRTQ